MESFPYKLKLARRAAGLTQDDVSQRIGMTKQAYGKYERGLVKPTSTRLIEFCDLFDRSPDYFAMAPRLDLNEVKFRKKSKLQGKNLYALKAEIAEAVENVLYLEERLGIERKYRKPNIKQAIPLTEVGDQIDELADRLREVWKLGVDALPNLRGLLEFHGIRVVEVHLDPSFDGLSSTVSGGVPVVVINTAQDQPDVRRRFTLAHELAHLLLDIDEDNIPKRTAERICDRFAGALLLPNATLKAVLGDYRSNLSLHELIAVRQQFGVSVAATVYRAAALGIYPESLARDFWIARKQDPDLFNEKGFPSYPSESLGRDYFKILLARAVAEEAISISKATAISQLSMDEVRELAKRPDGLAPRAYV